VWTTLERVQRRTAVVSKGGEVVAQKCRGGGTSDSLLLFLVTLHTNFSQEGDNQTPKREERLRRKKKKEKKEVEW